jgi:hypothetical protein
MHPMQDYFWKYFYMQGKFDMQPICTSMLANFYSYSCKKRVLQVCLVLAFIKRGRKVSFGEAWCSLKLGGVRTYAI